MRCYCGASQVVAPVYTSICDAYLQPLGVRMNRGTATESSGSTGQLAGLSALGKIRRFPANLEGDAAFREAVGGSQMLARLLLSRGITTAPEAVAFLNPEHLHAHQSHGAA